MQTEYIVKLQYTHWTVVFQILTQSNQDGLNATVESINLIDFEDDTNNGTGYPNFTAITNIKEIRTVQDLICLLQYKVTGSINVQKCLTKGYIDLSGNILTTLDDLDCIKHIYINNEEVYLPQAIGNQSTYFTFLGDPANLLVGMQLFELNGDETFYIPSTHDGVIYDGTYWDYTLANGIITDRVID